MPRPLAQQSHRRQRATVRHNRPNPMTSDLKLRVGRAITPEQFELLTDEQLVRLLPRSVREFFPGKDFCADGTFYLHDGTVWSFYKGGYLDE
jgi:hypothetical protein